MTTTDEHNVAVYYDARQGHQARCSCTWHGAWHRGGHTAADDAGDDADDHEDEHSSSSTLDDWEPIGYVATPASELPWSQPDARPIDDLRHAWEQGRP